MVEGVDAGKPRVLEDGAQQRLKVRVVLDDEKPAALP